MQARNWDAAQESENRASGFCSSQGSHSRGGEQPLLQWGSQRLAGEGTEIGGLPTCGPRSCSWSYIWRESGKPLQSVSPDAPLCHGDPVLGTTPKVLTSGALARHRKTDRSCKSKTGSPPFCMQRVYFCSLVCSVN